jgi:hypothetical protein
MLLSTPTESQIDVLRAAETREAGGDWAIRRSVGLECIEHGWLTEDYYLTDLGKRNHTKVETTPDERTLNQLKPMNHRYCRPMED